MPTFIHELTSAGMSQLQGALRLGQVGLSATNARQLLLVCSQVAEAIESSWTRVNDLLDRGEEGRRLRFLLLELRDVIDRAVSGYSEIRRRVEESPAFEGQEASLTSLHEVAQRVGSIRDQLEPILTLLESPPPLDPASIRGAGAVEKAEGYLSMDETMARIHSSGG